MITIVRLSERILKCSRCNFQKLEWADVTRNDIDEFMTELMESYSPDGAETEYTRDHKKTLKAFFRWKVFGYRSKEECVTEHGVGDPPETRHLKTKKTDSKLRRSDLITETEREWLLAECTHPMDAFMIDVGLDAGIRPGENFNYALEDIKQDKYGFKIEVEGKTGIRPIRLIKSTPRVAAWKNVHPFKDNPKAPVLISLKKSTYGQPQSYSAARQRLKAICEKVRKKHPEFTKRVYLNLFRHTDATESEKMLTKGLTNKKHGWSPNSNMSARYSHLIDNDVDEAILKHHGIEIEEEEKNIPQKCTICGMFNDADAKICSNCAKPLDVQTAMELQEKEKETNQSLQQQVNEMQEQINSIKYRSETKVPPTDPLLVKLLQDEEFVEKLSKKLKSTSS